MKVCRVCFSTDSKLYNMKQYNLDEPYETITGINVATETYPYMICVECTQRLLNCIRFRGKCIRGHIVLTEIWDAYGGLTAQAVNSVDRHQNGLASQLRVKHIEADHCDLYCEYTDREDTHPYEVAIEDNEEMEKYDALIVKMERDCGYENDFQTKIEVKEDSHQIGFVEEVAKKAEMQDDVDCSISEDDDFVESQVMDWSDEDTDLRGFLKKLGSDSDSDSSSITSIEARIIEKEAMKIMENWSKPKQNKCAKSSEKCVRQSETRVRKSKKCVKKSEKTKPLLDEDLSAHFTITNVTVEEQKEEVLKRKESNNYINSKFKCTECFKGFLDESTYNNHMVRHTKQCGEYQCEICKTYFHMARYLKKHMYCLHSHRYKCNECTFVTVDKGTAKRHILFHKGVKYKCDECPMEFNVSTSYLSHKRIKHSTDFVCQLCGHSFLSEKGVFFHKNIQHKLDKGEITSESPLCETCDIRFYSEDALKVHMAVSSKHNKNDTNYGDRPVRNAKKKKGQSKPKRPYEGPIPCEQCGEVLESPREYFYHFKRTHPGVTRTVYFNSTKQMIMCEQCGMMLQSECALKHHMYAHTGEKRFECDKCKKTFTFKYNLLSHMKTHSENQQMYNCPTCGIKITNRSNLNRHMKIHTGIKAYKCSVCDKSFLSSYERYTHNKYVHLKEPWPKRPPRRRNVPQAMEDYGE